jgi:hypothetical protein
LKEVLGFLSLVLRNASGHHPVSTTALTGSVIELALYDEKYGIRCIVFRILGPHKTL